MGRKAVIGRFERWDMCSLCEQRYHGVVACALGWACWKTYVGRPQTDQIRRLAMGVLGNGLGSAGHNEDALSVGEAELATMRRVGTSEGNILVAQSNLAITYQKLGRQEQALQIERDVYSGRLRLNGAESMGTLVAANNCGSSLVDLRGFEEAKSLLRETIPVARRVLGDSHDLTLRMRWNYANALYEDDGAPLDDLREAVATLVEIEPTARRVLGGSHPVAMTMETSLRNARAALDALAAREAQDPPPV